jgi:hypothetical protein
LTGNFLGWRINPRASNSKAIKGRGQCDNH